MLRIIVKPAVIPKIFVVVVFCTAKEIRNVSGNLIVDESVTRIGKVNDIIIQGIATHNNKDGFILIDHFFINIRER